LSDGGYDPLVFRWFAILIWLMACCFELQASLSPPRHPGSSRHDAMGILTAATGENEPYYDLTPLSDGE